MPLTQYRPIYEDDELIVFLKPSGSDVAILAFNNYGTIYPTPQVWGTDFIDRTGFNAVVFMAKKRNWFPARSMLPAIEAAGPLLGRPGFSFTFGNSMGGYAAIKYQKPLGADACLAFNPQYTLDPAGCSFDPRFASYWTPEMAGMDIGPGDVDRRAFVFYDPGNRQDAGHVRALAGMAEIHEIQVLHTDHVTVRSVVLGSTISEMVGIIRTDGADIAAARIRLLLRRSKKSSYDYYNNLAKALVARKHARMLPVVVDFMEKHSRLKDVHVERVRQLVREAEAAAEAEAEALAAASVPPEPVPEPPPEPPSAHPPALAAQGLPRFAGAAARRPGWLERLWPFGRKDAAG